MFVAASQYKPTIVSKTEISFIPMKNNTYAAIVQDDDDDTIGLPIDQPATEFSNLYNRGEIYTTPTPDADSESEAGDDIFSLGKDPVNVFYIGSITVLGLYIFYRILSKTK